MPADDRLGLNEDQGLPPLPPEPMQPYPEEPVGEADSGALDLLAQRGQCCRSARFSEREISPRSDCGPEGEEKRSQQTNHAAGVSTGHRIRSTWRSRSSFGKGQPLSPLAITVLDRVRARTGEGEWAFPGPKGSGPIANPQKAADRLKARSGGGDPRVHDFRRTAASVMASIGVSRFVIGRVLNHAERDVTAVYDRYSYEKEKRTALEAWGRKLESIVSGEELDASVVPFSRA